MHPSMGLQESIHWQTKWKGGKRMNNLVADWIAKTIITGTPQGTVSEYICVKCGKKCRMLVGINEDAPVVCIKEGCDDD
jgi:hypothetical protein